MSENGASTSELVRRKYRKRRPTTSRLDVNAARLEKWILENNEAAVGKSMLSQ
jgi:hypothetical protein